MFADASIIERIFSKIDQDELVNMAMALADFYSPTGCEQEIAQFILTWFEENGFHAIKQEVERDRFNAVGMLRGAGGGPSLTFNGHLDIVIWRWSAKPIKAYVSDGRIYGTEIGNMKAALAAFMIGAKAIKEAGIQLRGDLILATVIGEISTGAVGQLQGPQDRGEGLGTRHLLANGVQSDYAIVADCSEFAVVPVACGVALFRISTKGTEIYTPFGRRSENVDESNNAVVRMTKTINTIENWAREYERSNIYKFPGGQVEPKVGITGIQGGMPQLMPGEWRTPFTPCQSPLSCDLYVDVRIPPGMSPIKIKHELEEVLKELPFEYEMEMFRSQRGYESTGPELDYLSSAVEKSYEHVFQSKPPSPLPGVSSMWTDANLYREIGIPTVDWGPSNLQKYSNRRAVEVAGLVQAAKVYSLIALEVCGEMK